MTRKRTSRADATLETLLDLDGTIFLMDNGYWTKFEAVKVTPSSQIPHGIKYSITLHDRNNTRIVGFDNAHSFKPKKRKFSARKITWDHQHRRDQTQAYEFESASQLLEDFWKAVEQIIK
jgi:hypothetical protein